MSGTFPATPAPARIRVRSIQPTRVSVAHSLKRYTRTLNAQRWAFSLDFPPMERADWMPIWAFILAQRGQFDTFQWVLPNPLHTPQGLGAAGSPSPAVNGNFGSPAEAQTGRNIYTDGWSASVTVLKAGDFIKYGSHSKVYQMTADAATDSGGAVQLAHDPALVQAVYDGDTIITNSVPVTVSLAQDTNEFAVAPGQIFSGGTLELIEAL